MPERFIGPDTYREAYKINKLVDEELVTPQEASEASRQEIADMVEKIFNKKFSQNYFNPAEIQGKTMGQKAEDILVELLNKIPWFHARHATEREDAVQKTDLALSIEGDDREIPIQLATYTDPDRLKQKKSKLPKEVVLVALPMGNIFKAFERNDPDMLKNVIMDFVRQVLETIRTIPDYLSAYEHLQEQLAAV